MCLRGGRIACEQLFFFHKVQNTPRWPVSAVIFLDIAILDPVRTEIAPALRCNPGGALNNGVTVNRVSRGSPAVNKHVDLVAQGGTIESTHVQLCASSCVLCPAERSFLYGQRRVSDIRGN